MSKDCKDTLQTLKQRSVTTCIFRSMPFAPRCRGITAKRQHLTDYLTPWLFNVIRVADANVHTSDSHKYAPTLLYVWEYTTIRSVADQRGVGTRPSPEFYFWVFSPLPSLPSLFSIHSLHYLRHKAAPKSSGVGCDTNKHFWDKNTSGDCKCRCISV